MPLPVRIPICSSRRPRPKPRGSNGPKGPPERTGAVLVSDPKREPLDVVPRFGPHLIEGGTWREWWRGVSTELRRPFTPQPRARQLPSGPTGALDLKSSKKFRDGASAISL
eukprot:5630880-Pyramimonas_sp.AAC.1